MRMDFTLNIPTMLGMLAMVASTTTAGFTVYKDLSDRQMTTNFAVAAQQQRIEKIETSLGQLKLENSVGNDKLRAEIKSDISEIKGMLNEMIFGRARPNTHLKEWQK